MKFFMLMMISVGAVCALTLPETSPVKDANQPQPEQPAKLDLQQVEQMLQQIEKDQTRLQPIAAAESDPTVPIALQKLFTQFRQLTSAYVDVLNAVNKSLGLPKYPKLPGFSRQRRGIMDTPPIKQITENLSQLGTSITEVGQMVTRIISNVSEDSRKTVLKQFHRFTDLWSNQLGEISRMLDPKNMALMMRSEGELMGRADGETIFQQINRHLTQLGNDVQKYVDDLLNNIRNRVVGPRRSTGIDGRGGVY